MRQTARSLPIAFLLLAATGCASSHTYLPMTIEVRDKLTREPVSDALVVARTVHLYLPLSYLLRVELPLLGSDPILNPSPPRWAHGTTGEDGIIRLEVIADHPVQIMVIAGGYDPQVVYLEKHPGITGEPSGWLEADPAAATAQGPPRLEVRFLP